MPPPAPQPPDRDPSRWRPESLPPSRPPALPLPLCHRDYGDPADPATPILLIHGLFGSAANWQPVVTGLHRRLGADRRLIVPDLRNHGRSPHDAILSYEAMAADLIGLLDGRGIECVSLVGHSLGGKVAMWLALNWPERIEALAVVDIAPVTYGSRFRRLIAALRGLNLKMIDSRRDADNRLAADIPDPLMRGFLLQNLRKTEAGWAWRINLAALPDAMEGLRTFPDPRGRQFHGQTAFIHGARSDYVTPSQLPLLHTLFPRAELLVIPDAGHWVHADQLEVFTQALANFLSG
jgi:esterase